ncbi:MAG: cytochrome c [Flavobacteriales bacterium]|nr:Cytochrome c6 [Flavobacteriales bacterium]MCC6575802.1 cytochrome c [Flavobacteriales bacterium]NUQ13957.1 cytochrome c [Flavobacteriales bacterium]
MKMLVMALGTITLFLMAHGPGPQPHSGATGRDLFELNCARCHGSDGAKGRWGARNLRKSRLSDGSIAQQIRQGRGIMPAFGNKLKPEEVAAILRYVKSLRDP